LGQAERPGHRLHTYEYFIGGFYTGLCASFVETPIDLFKTKMQIQIIRAQSGHPQQYRNVFNAGYVIIKQFGIRGAYQGLGATLLRNGPSYSLAFGGSINSILLIYTVECLLHLTAGVLEGTRNYCIPEGGTSRDVTNAQHLFAGGAGGVIYWIFTYPTDVIKSSMQSDSSEKSDRKFKNIVDCAKRLYREEGGWRRFYRGYTPCMLRAIPANAAMFTVVEKCRELFP
jgi:solute carrier family 25 carnitine/acylcarnitine transporter 20/29